MDVNSLTVTPRHTDTFMQAHERYEGGTFGHYGRIMGGWKNCMAERKKSWQREKLIIADRAHMV